VEALTVRRRIDLSSRAHWKVCVVWRRQRCRKVVSAGMIWLEVFLLL